jgi:hypothetical protein
MRKILIFIQLIIVFLIAGNINAQNPRLELKYTVVAESSINSGDAEIRLSVDGEQPPFTFQLFDKAPWEGGKEIASTEKTTLNQYSFTNLKNGKYLACVSDSNGNSVCEYVIIEIE